MKGYLKSASSVKTGKKFYESRLAKNYSIDDVAEILYVNKDYVRAIESGNFSIFPSKIFAKAYFCLLYTSPSPRDSDSSRMPSSA